jgi:hypothetical protein
MEYGEFEYQKLLEKVVKDETSWSVISSINFEERSLRFGQDLLHSLERKKSGDLHWFPIRLISHRTSPWSTLEMVKNQFERKLETISRSIGFNFRSYLLEYPLTQDLILEILSKARGRTKSPPKLILDLSALPRNIITFACDIVLGIHSESWHVNFDEIYFVFTPPEREISAQIPYHMTVGSIKGVYHPEIAQRSSDLFKTTLIVFPGNGGFEAQVAVDTLRGHQTKIHIAVDCFDPTFPTAMDRLIRNLSLVADASSGALEIDYYFSQTDALRVALELVDQAVMLCEEFPNARHSFLCAPFGSKWSVLVSSLARLEFLKQTRISVPDGHVMTDILGLSTNQYVSLYSRGSKTPFVLRADL